MPKVNVKDRRRAQLIEANMASIAKRGLTETTITHIAEAAGMSRGIINFYFTTKEIMMQATCQQLADDYEEQWQQAIAKRAEPELALKNLVEAHFHNRICNSKRLSVWAAFWAHAPAHPAYQRIISKSDHAIVTAIEDALKVLKLSEPKEKARQFHALLRGQWLAFLLSPDSVDRKHLADQCLASLLQEQSAPAKPKPVVGAPVLKPEPKAKKLAKKPVAETGQLDFEDLLKQKALGL